VEKLRLGLWSPKTSWQMCSPKRVGASAAKSYISQGNLESNGDDWVHRGFRLRGVCGNIRSIIPYVSGMNK
jgi:hypothetical protein